MPPMPYHLLPFLKNQMDKSRLESGQRHKDLPQLFKTPLQVPLLLFPNTVRFPFLKPFLSLSPFRRSLLRASRLYSSFFLCKPTSDPSPPYLITVVHLPFLAVGQTELPEQREFL